MRTHTCKIALIRSFYTHASIVWHYDLRLAQSFYTFRTEQVAWVAWRSWGQVPPYLWPYNGNPSSAFCPHWHADLTFNLGIPTEETTFSCFLCMLSLISDPWQIVTKLITPDEKKSAFHLIPLFTSFGSLFCVCLLPWNCSNYNYIKMPLPFELLRPLCVLSVVF